MLVRRVLVYEPPLQERTLSERKYDPDLVDLIPLLPAVSDLSSLEAIQAVREQGFAWAQSAW